ncbi:hypothetical protein [uncultured Helicobacter sp.]|uniref:hypothetical protein n=1 Tax=uncultured Helicobacter sp. TaxID=175537 RepID=UPI0037518533
MPSAGQTLPTQAKKPYRHISKNEKKGIANGDYQSTQALLDRYATQARLVITTALHCASPCTAMGIPVLFLQDSPEQSTRFSALHNPKAP